MNFLKGFLSRVTQGITGTFIGIILFLVSFVVLFNNEGREDLSIIVQTTPVVDALEESNATGLVALYGMLEVKEDLTDGMFLAPNKYLAVRRNVEKFTIKEVTETTKNADGTSSSETKIVKEWEKMTNEGEHGFLLSKTIRASAGIVGLYEINASSVELPGYTKIGLSKENIMTGSWWTGSNSSYLFSGKGSLTIPKEFDYRISYEVINPGQNVTVLGKVNGKQFNSMNDSENRHRYRMFRGTKDDAVATLHSEYTMVKRGMRALGFVLMRVGLTMMFGLITSLASIVPAIGKITGALIKGVAFIVAAVLSALTIWISMLLHSLIAVIIVAVVVIGGIVVWYFLLKKKSIKAPNVANVANVANIPKI